MEIMGKRKEVGEWKIKKETNKIKKKIYIYIKKTVVSCPFKGVAPFKQLCLNAQLKCPNAWVGSQCWSLFTETPKSNEKQLLAGMKDGFYMCCFPCITCSSLTGILAISKHIYMLNRSQTSQIDVWLLFWILLLNQAAFATQIGNCYVPF